MNYVQCNGKDDCPFCRMFKGIPKKKKYLINVIDKKDGRIKVMSMSQLPTNEFVGLSSRGH